MKKHSFLILLAFLAQVHLCAQQSASTRGKDFWLGFMKNYDQDSAEELKLFISSDYSTSGVVMIPGQNYSQSFNVVANTTTTVVIPNAIGEMTTFNTTQNRGIHILTQDTVSVFAINFNPSTADATKILPVSALGTAYLAASYTGIAGYESEMLIVATEDDSEIEITPSVSLDGGYPAGVPFTVALQEGECIQLRTTTGGDLTGSLVRSSASNGQCRPFALLSGADCANITTTCGPCDHIFEQNFPVSLWGETYYITPWVFNTTIPDPLYTWRILASQDNTNVVVDASTSYSLNAGEFIEFNHDPAAHCVVGDAPIAVIQYMESLDCGGNGDPAMVILDDRTKKISQITFATVESAIINDHFLNLVIAPSQLGQVFLDDVMINPNLFFPFSGCVDQMWCGIPITPGSHLLSAPNGGATGYVYGIGATESYAYSIGSFSPILPIEYDETVCSNGSINLEIDNSLLDPIWYHIDSPTEILHTGHTWTISNPAQSGSYVGYGLDATTGCPEETFFSVETPTPPTFNYAPSQSICQLESVQLWAEPANTLAEYMYEWSPSAGLNNANIANPIATPDVTTIYTVAISTPSGCATASGSVTITVQPGSISSMQLNIVDTTFCAGGSADLFVVTENTIWSDDFDPSIAWGSWQTITNGAANALCGSVSDQALYFNGLTTREAISNPMNVENGGHIHFYLKIGSGAAPCDNAEPGDNVVLSYSVNNGSWVPFQTFYESGYADFTEMEIDIPPAAWSSDTRFRWHQIGLWLNNQDNWVLDNVSVGAVQTEDYLYAWSPTTNLSIIDNNHVLVEPSTNAVYTVTLTDGVFGCTYVDSVLINVQQPFILQVPGDTTLCETDGLQLYALPDSNIELTYQWSPAVNIDHPFIAEPTVAPTSATIYHVTATSEGGCTAEADVSVDVAQLTDLELTASDYALCPGETTQLSANFTSNSGSLELQWTPTATVAQPNLPNTLATPLTTTVYSLVVSYLDACVWEEEIEIAVVPTFTIEANLENLSSCNMIGTLVEANADTMDPLNWSWSPANLVDSPSLSSTFIANNATDLLVVEAENGAGCIARDTIQLDYLSIAIDWPALIEICEDSLLILDTSLPETYIFDWNVSQNSSFVLVIDPGVYQVTATSPEGCISEAETEVIFYSFPPLPAMADTSLCEGESLMLDAFVGTYDYLWNTGSQQSTLNVNSSGLYEVTIDNGFCFTQASAQVNVFGGPVAPFGSNTLEICLEYPPYHVLLDAQNEGMNFLWNNGSTSQILEVTSPGNYQVTVNSEQGCNQSYDMEIRNTCPGVLFIPNSFTPDQDGINDFWSVEGDRIGNFEVLIYNRWGEVFYQSKEVDFKWIGQRRNGDFFAEPGVYPYLIKVQFLDDKGLVGQEQLINGFVTLIR